MTHKHVRDDATQTHYFYSTQLESLDQQCFGFPGLYPDEVAIWLRCKDAFYHPIPQGGYDILYYFKSRIFTCHLDFYDLTEGWQRVKHQPVSARQLIENRFALQPIAIERIRPLEIKRSGRIDINTGVAISIIRNQFTDVAEVHIPGKQVDLLG